MIRTEADMIVNLINHHHINHYHINHHHIDHHHIIHHQGITYNILNFLNFSMKRNHPSINLMIFKMIMEGEGGSLILTLIGEADTLTLIEEAGFLIISVIKENNT